MKVFIILFISSLFASVVHTQVPVFTSGTEGHQSYRIPAIIKNSNGDLLAFAEGRVHGSNDFGDINIVVKKSNDHGKTWSPMITVVDYKDQQAGNPAPVVDLTDPIYPNGRLFLFYNTGNNHEGEIRKGNGLREVWYKTSTDGGNTWSKAVNITAQTHRPKQPNINAEYNFTEDWRWYANTPGHAMQFDAGKYKGRIYVAANHSSGDPKPKFTEYNAHGFYTDDHGKTFKLAESVNIPGSNEATSTPISNDRLLLNARNQQGDKKARIISISNNGGETWDQTYFDDNLPDPVCEGSILSIGKKRGKYILAFCNAAHTTKRDSLTLRISMDEGKFWPVSKLIYAGKEPDAKSPSAYSDIIQLNKKTIGVLFEKDNYSQIVFSRAKWR